MIYTIDWEKAINTRRSIRSFKMESIGCENIEKLKKFIGSIELPFEHNTEIKFFQPNQGKRLANNLKNPPPDNIAFISDTDTENISKTGFIGELVILYAVSLGIDTCWYGHYIYSQIKQLLGDEIEELEKEPIWGYGKGAVKGKQVICIAPLGYWKEEGMRIFDRLQTAVFSHKRKPITDLLENCNGVDKISEDIIFALDLARKAPSAANSQFWRFNVSSDYNTINIAKPKGYKHFKWEHPDVDIGICASHFWLGLMIKNIKFEMAILSEDERIVWSFKIL